MSGVVGNNNDCLMKKTLFFIAAAIAFVACATKENPDPQVIDNPSTTGKVTLTATMPQFASTKAGVDNEGNFTWTVGDEIAVKYGENYYTFECKNANGTFSLKDGQSEPSGDPTAAYYPLEYRGTASNQEFASLDAAAKGFQMTASYDSGKLNFVHDNAMMVVTLTNVPYFTKYITVGEASVEVSYTEDQESLTVYIPVAPVTTAAKLSIALKDAASTPNSFISKTSANEVAIVASNLYNLPDLSINNYIVFTGSTNNTHALGLGVRKYDGTWVGSWAEFTLFNNGTIKYYVLPDAYASAEAIQVELRQNDGGESYAKSTSEYILPVRDLIFDVSKNYLEADYRIYPYGTTEATYLYATYGTGTYNTPDNVTISIIQDGTVWKWDELYCYAYNITDETDIFKWPGTKTGGSSFTISSNSLYGKNVRFVFNINNGYSWGQTMDYDVDFSTAPFDHIQSLQFTLNSTWYDTENINKRNISLSASVEADEILSYPLGSYPGKAVSVPASISASNYVTIPAECYGKTLNLVFNNNGGGTSVNWNNLLINRDYNYSFK